MYSPKIKLLLKAGVLFLFCFGMFFFAKYSVNKQSEAVVFEEKTIRSDRIVCKLKYKEYLDYLEREINQPYPIFKFKERGDSILFKSVAKKVKDFNLVFNSYKTSGRFSVKYDKSENSIYFTTDVLFSIEQRIQ